VTQLRYGVRCGPILPYFRDIASFLLITAPHPYSTRILGVFLLDYVASVGAPWREDPKIITQIITFKPNLYDHGTSMSQTD